MRDPCDGHEYAVKMEDIDVKLPQLEYEFNVYRELQGCPGIPLAFSWWPDKTQKKFCLAMQVMGPSLDKCMNKITEWDIVHWIAPKAISILEHVHNRHLVHRDVKPENFLTGRSGINSHEIYLVDFGLSKKFRDAGGQHIPYHSGKSLTGTVRYASINTHRGIQQSRRDDLESLGYVLLFLLKKKLPWAGLPAADQQDQNEKVARMKYTLPLETLCEGLPPAFLYYFRYIRKLEYDATPDYGLLKGYFSTMR